MQPSQILVIDDDEDDVSLLSEAFTKCGVNKIHYVFSAMDAFMYLQGIEHSADLPHLIITDHYLPVISGIEFMQNLKIMSRYKDIHVLVLANIQSEEVEKYRQLGVSDHFNKPVTYDEYVELARKITDKIITFPKSLPNRT